MGAWEEANAALAAKEAGKVVALYKVSGQRRVLTVLDVESHDELDRIWMAGLPMARHLELKEVLPVREYEAFADDVRRRWQEQPAWAWRPGTLARRGSGRSSPGPLACPYSPYVLEGTFPELRV